MRDSTHTEIRETATRLADEALREPLSLDEAATAELLWAACTLQLARTPAEAFATCTGESSTGLGAGAWERIRG